MGHFNITDHNRIVVLRDPHGKTDFEKGEISALWMLADIRAKVPVRGSDPRTSAKDGVIYLSVEEFTRTFEHFEIAHERDGYKEAYYDQENDTGDEAHFKIVPTEPITGPSDLYITVETYFKGLICSKVQQPTVRFFVYRDYTLADVKYYRDDYVRPIRV